MASSWERLGSTTLGSAGDQIDVTITAKKYLIIKVYAEGDGGTAKLRMRFNDDSGSNYWYRANSNGGSDGYSSSAGTIMDIDNVNLDDGEQAMNVLHVINILNKEKLCINHHINNGGVGASNVPDRVEQVTKWDNTSAQITKVSLINPQAGSSYATGSTVTVWGADDQTSTDKSKTSITNVEVGTRYEEVDTKKIFRRKAGASAYSGYNQTNVDEDVPLRPSWGGGTRGGIIIQSGHTLIGNAINKVTFRSKKNGSPSGTAYLRIWNNAGTVVYEVGSKLASEFPTSRGDVVFENTTATYTIAENDRIALDYTAGDASNNVTWGMKNSSTPSSENVIDYPSNGWRTQSGRQTSYKAEKSAEADSWVEKGTA